MRIETQNMYGPTFVRIIGDVETRFAPGSAIRLVRRISTLRSVSISRM